MANSRKILIRLIANPQVRADAIWILLLVGTILLIHVGLELTQSILYIALAVFVLRFAPQIPGLRWFWVGLFGNRTFWEWMTLLCAPLILATIGFRISSFINQEQSDIAINNERLNLSNDYYNQMSELILKSEFQALASSRIKQSTFTTNDEENCDPIRGKPLTSIAYSRTVSVLRTLEPLRLSHEQYTPLQLNILQLLYYSKLIWRHGHVISLQKASFKGSFIDSVDLSESCLDSVDFSKANLRQVKLSNSNIIRASLRDTDLYKAKLDRVNFFRSDLSNANASEASIKYSYLRETTMKYANLRNANFYASDLSNANLSHADLKKAYLFRSNLEGADLSGADLRGADLRFAKINAKTKLNQAKFNEITLSNTNKVKLNSGIHSILKYFRINSFFDIDKLLVDELRLDPTKFSPNNAKEIKLKMSKDHAI